MNRHCHRIIFNVSRGQRMAVAETASSHSAGGGTTDYNNGAFHNRQTNIDRIAGLYVTNSQGTLLASAADVQASEALKLNAGQNITITQAEKTTNYDYATRSSSSGLLNSSTTVQRDSATSSTAIGSSFGGNTVAITSGKDLSIQGSQVIADADLQLKAGNNVTIAAAQESYTSSHFYSKSESGLLSGGSGLSITVGERYQDQGSKSRST